MKNRKLAPHNNGRHEFITSKSYVYKRSEARHLATIASETELQQAEVACPRPGGPLQGGQRPDLRGPMHRAPPKQLLATILSTGAGGGISIGHRRSGCPSRGGVLREYRRKTLKNGPLNGGPARERQGGKEMEKKQEEAGGWGKEVR
ncbi:hypothetical protein HZU67_04335 [Apis mellifera carnica]|nr:hypothetical protein HZU67_04335 [Apis mellifera carnica]